MKKQLQINVKIKMNKKHVVMIKKIPKVRHPVERSYKINKINKKTKII